MIHSGSRNFGHAIAEHFIKIAEETNPVHGDLAYLDIDSDDCRNYIMAMNYAMDYAKESRVIMMRDVLNSIENVCGKFSMSYSNDIHHNFAEMHVIDDNCVWIHRKGATSAYYGNHGIIPGSMGTNSYIVRGLQNNFDSFWSCSHGAGRTHSRMGATRSLDQKEQEEIMGNVVFDGFDIIKRGSKKVRGMTDLGEAPGAYKSIDDVMDAQSDIVEILHKLKPLMVVKG